MKDRTKLLGGPYRAPAVCVGDRATCLYRDCEVVVTSWRDARFSWPMCALPDVGGFPSPLVDEELARAIRTESALALQYWWNAGVGLVAKGGRRSALIA
jgi:hypothetical protein